MIRPRKFNYVLIMFLLLSSSVFKAELSSAGNDVESNSNKDWVPLTVSISGPTRVYEGIEYNWEAIVVGGEGYVMCEWYFANDCGDREVFVWDGRHPEIALTQSGCLRLYATNDGNQWVMAGWRVNVISVPNVHDSVLANKSMAVEQCSWDQLKASFR